MVAYTVKVVKIVKFLVRIYSEHSQKTISLMLELKTVGPFLVQKLKWGGHGPPGPQPQRLRPWIIFAKIKLEILYPPSYFRDVKHYKDANTDLIKQAIDMFHWDRAFVNTYVNDLS